MSRSSVLRRVLQGSFVAAMFVGLGCIQASEPDPAVMSFKLPKQINWVTSPSGAIQANLAGDPDKPGMYVILVKWTPHHMSRPHFHATDRLVTVISGTWWVGWGTKYDPDSTYPMPAGSFVRHYANQIHYDGAKDEEAVIQIVGMGPATSIPADKKK